MADEEKVIKPSLNDYVQAFKATQGNVISCVVITGVLLVCGWSMESSIAYSLALGTGVLGVLMWMRQYQPVERIKAKAIVLSSQRVIRMNFGEHPVTEDENKR